MITPVIQKHAQELDKLQMNIKEPRQDVNFISVLNKTTSMKLLI